jgi:hypothetical protein
MNRSHERWLLHEVSPRSQQVLSHCSAPCAYRHGKTLACMAKRLMRGQRLYAHCWCKSSCFDFAVNLSDITIGIRRTPREYFPHRKCDSRECPCQYSDRLCQGASGECRLSLRGVSTRALGSGGRDSYHEHCRRVIECCVRRIRASGVRTLCPQRQRHERKLLGVGSMPSFDVNSFGAAKGDDPCDTWRTA